MEFIIDGFKEAFILIASGDPEVFNITVRTLRVCLTATAVSVLIGVPLGLCIALKSVPGRELIFGLVYTGMGLPPVAAGLWVSLIFWRSGPLGSLELMYTPWAIIIAQAVIAVPVVAGLTVAALHQLHPKLPLQLKALGASPVQSSVLLIRESFFGLLAAVIAGFGSVISEVGAAIMVGGNIKGHTRVLTTATVLEVARGNFARAIALTLILFFVSYAVVFCLVLLQRRRRRIWVQ